MEPSPRCLPLDLDAPVLVLESNAVSSSALGLLDHEGCYTTKADLALGADSVLSSAHGRAFVNVRDQNVLREIDRDLRIVASFTPSEPGEDDTNPWDVDADAEGRLWVARYNADSVGVLAADGAWTGAVDLSSLADDDGLPEMSSIRVVGDRAYVVLERLDFPRAVRPGAVAVIDVATRALVTSFPLNGSNPFGRMSPTGQGDGVVAIAEPGDHDSLSPDDGIDLVDLKGQRATRIVDELELGGSAIAVVLVGPDEAYAIVEGPEPKRNPTRLVRFDPAIGRVTRTLADTRADEPGFYHSGLAVSGNLVLVGDRTPGRARIRVFDRETGAEADPIPASNYPPFDLLALPPPEP